MDELPGTAFALTPGEEEDDESVEDAPEEVDEEDCPRRPGGGAGFKQLFLVNEGTAEGGWEVVVVAPAAVPPPARGRFFKAIIFGGLRRDKPEVFLLESPMILVILFLFPSIARELEGKIKRNVFALIIYT